MDQDQKKILDDKLPEWGDKKSLDRELARARVEKIFSVAAPHPSNLEKHETVVNWSQNLAMVFFEVLPECEETKIALVKLQESVMWANEAIARHPLPVKEKT